MSTGLLLFLALSTVSAPAADTDRSEPPDVAVVCPDEFRPELAPWVDHRTEQGRRIAVLSSDGSSADIRGRIVDVARQGKLKFVVLVGDANPAGTTTAERDDRLRRRSVPTHYAPSKVGIHWGSEPQIATDNPYADFDGDGRPDAAIGRLTCDTPDELSRIVGKILAYEKSTDLGMWRRRVNFVAGVGGFGALADAAIETAAQTVICDGVPAAYATTVTYGSWRSPYCPPPAQFHQTTLDRLNEGSLFWVYIGHGQRRWLDVLRVPGKGYPILSTSDVGRMRSIAGAPIALFLACYTGAFDEPQDCLAEEMLRSDGAPVAAICGSRATMPYAMTVMSGELMQECFVRRRETIGEVVLHAKRSLLDEKGTAPNRETLDAIAALVSPKGTTPADERAEHVLLFNLIGDPLLRIPHPADVRVDAPRFAVAGEKVKFSGTCDVDGRCTAELVVRRDRLAFDPPDRDRYDESAESMARYAELYRRANDPRLATTTLRTSRGAFSAEIDVPADIDGPCNVRVFVEGERRAAIGACDVYVRPRRGDATASVPAATAK
ncbi:MAG: C25 family cysteine peptidase [Pirellulales bacterium]